MGSVRLVKGVWRAWGSNDATRPRCFVRLGRRWVVPADRWVPCFEEVGDGVDVGRGAMNLPLFDEFIEILEEAGSGVLGFEQIGPQLVELPLSGVVAGVHRFIVTLGEPRPGLL